MKPEILLCSLALSLFARASLAGDAAAEALFRAGREAADKGDDAVACARFEESHRLEPAAGTVFNLALCYERRGQLASAWQRFRETKDRLPNTDDRVALVEQRIAALEPRLPKLTLNLPAGSGGATVLRDGVEQRGATLGIAVPVDPGAHEIVVRAPGHAPHKEAVTLAEGQSKVLELTLGPAEASTAEVSGKLEPTPVRSSGSSQKTVGYVIGGVGVAGIATSMVTGVMVLNRKSKVEDECTDGVCTRAGANAAKSGRTLSTVSTVAFAAGAVGVGVGLYLTLSAKPDSESAKLEFVTAPGAAALNLSGAF
ncbi:MAG TPA: hypothetical protein VG937_03220 [Polyangiaceae bacterium]|jgi:hypothetical protein|nr:hypothetical protein [Polyangiaceae bacterium]